MENVDQAIDLSYETAHDIWPVPSSFSAELMTKLLRHISPAFSAALQARTNSIQRGVIIAGPTERPLSTHTASQIAKDLIAPFVAQNPQKTFVKAELEHLHAVLSQIFPGEAPGYNLYLNYKDGHCHGYLGNAVSWAKGFYKDLGLLDVRKRKHNAMESALSTISAQNVLTREEQKAAELRVQTMIDPWPDTLIIWHQTFAVRREVREAKSIVDYMQQYQCLKHNDAYQLIESDFEQLRPHYKFPDPIDNLNLRFSVLRKCLADSIPKLMKKKSFSAQKDELKDMKTQLERVDLDQLAVINMCLVFLPLLVVPKPRGGKIDKPPFAGQPYTRPLLSKLFAGVYSSENEFFEEQQLFNGELDKVEESIDNHVVFALIGSKEHWAGLKGIVRLADINFRFDSPLDAAILAVKLFYALKMHYTVPARHLWWLVQAICLGIEQDPHNYASTSAKELFLMFKRLVHEEIVVEEVLQEESDVMAEVESQQESTQDETD